MYTFISLFLIGFLIIKLATYTLMQSYINPVVHRLDDDRYRVIDVWSSGKDVPCLHIYLKNVEEKSVGEIIEFLRKFQSNRIIDEHYDMISQKSAVNYIVDTLGYYRVNFYTKNAKRYEDTGMGKGSVMVTVTTTKDSNVKRYKDIGMGKMPETVTVTTPKDSLLCFTFYRLLDKSIHLDTCTNMKLKYAVE